MEERSLLPVDEQLKVITSGTMQIVPLEELKKKLEKGTPLNIKLGVDPTSPDLHLGHAVPLRKMRQFQDLGHNVTLIIGNGTALIGDPSGRDSTRPPLTEEQVEANAQTYVEQAMKVLDPEKTTVLHNGEWLKGLNLAEMLKIMSQFNVARILEREDFHNRYTEGKSIGLHEFIYPVLQAYDSVVIKADLEMGGNDQIFNLLAGRDLMRAMGMEPQVALTMPLLVGTDGHKKMSPSPTSWCRSTGASAPRPTWTSSTPSTPPSRTVPPTRTRSSASWLPTSWTSTTARAPAPRRAPPLTHSSSAPRPPRTCRSSP